MINKDEYKPYSEKMDKAISVLKSDLSTIRAGRANPAILDKLTIEYYGTTTPVTQVGSISVPEARMIVFQPWDMSTIKLVEKAILASDIGITPQSDGKTIKLIFPPLTEERRKALAKDVKKMAEESKVAIRNIRRDAIEYFKGQKKKSVITEDDLKDAEKEIPNVPDKKIAEIDKVIAAKEKEIMEI